MKFGSIYAKAIDLESNYKFNKYDLVLFISPRANFRNNRNAEKTEPVFDKFPFTTRLLDQANGIENLFALNKDIYKEIYKRECSIKINEYEEIEKFKSIILSRGNFKKIIVSEEDKEKFILNA